MRRDLFLPHPQFLIYIEKSSYFFIFHIQKICKYVCISFKLIAETSKVKQIFSKLWVRHLVLYSCVMFYLTEKWQNILFFFVTVPRHSNFDNAWFYSIIVSNQGASFIYAMQNNIQRNKNKSITFEKID